MKNHDLMDRCQCNKVKVIKETPGVVLASHPTRPNTISLVKQTLQFFCLRKLTTTKIQHVQNSSYPSQLAQNNNNTTTGTHIKSILHVLSTTSTKTQQITQSQAPTMHLRKSPNRNNGLHGVQHVATSSSSPESSLSVDHDVNETTTTTKTKTTSRKTRKKNATMSSHRWMHMPSIVTKSIMVRCGIIDGSPGKDHDRFGGGYCYYYETVVILLSMVSILLVLFSAFRIVVGSLSPLSSSSSSLFGIGHRSTDSFPWMTMHRSLSFAEEGYVDSTSFSNDDVLKTTATSSTSSIFYDNSLFYHELRQSYDNFFSPNDDRRSIDAVEKLRSVKLASHAVPPTSTAHSNSKKNNNHDDANHEYYDVYNCPDTPPRGYPYEWKLWDDILTSWPADDMEYPKSGSIYNGLCIFDYQKDYDKAMTYRDAELPFVVKGDPDVARTVERWNQQHYLSALLGDLKMPAEFSETSQFMYWSTRHASRHQIEETKWEAPTQMLEMTYGDWHKVANLTDEKLLAPDMPHHYFKVQGCSARAAQPTSSKRPNVPPPPCAEIPGSVPFLADEFPFYTQAHTSLYIKEPDTKNGKPINCRFGMKGVIVANHFDGERNFVTVLQGERRYILSRPNQCSNLCLFAHDHPSGRHSMVDYTNPDFDEFPEFADARATEVVLQPGDSLYLPTLWFHFIVSLSLNIQCNTRSGLDLKYTNDLSDCGYA